jgi:Golgi phosphoprotein 3 (GPP34)
VQVSRVTDDLYLISHDERTGGCLIDERTAALGLAAGMLSELALTGHLQVSVGRLIPGTAQGRPTDQVQREVLSLVLACDLRCEVQSWLHFVAAQAAGDVRYRMVRDGILAQVTLPRTVRRCRTVHLPVNPQAAAWPAIRLAKHLTHGLPLSLGDQVLVGLVQVMGLLDKVLWLKPDQAPGWDRARQVRRGLTAGLGELVAHADAAVGQGRLWRSAPRPDSALGVAP